LKMVLASTGSFFSMFCFVCLYFEKFCAVLLIWSLFDN